MMALRVFLIVGAGVVAAMQIGKAVIAIPALQPAMSLSLVEASAVLSLFALFGATLGVPTGLAVQRIGASRALLGGLALLSLGSVLGAAATSFVALLASRVVEGLGFILVVTSAPVLLGQAVQVRSRGPVLALWGIYMPVGMGLMTLAGLFLDLGAWRALWAGNAVLAALWFVAAAALLPADLGRPSHPAERPSMAASVRHLLSDRRALLMAFSFFLYGSLYYAVVGFLPLFLTGEAGVAAGWVAPLTAIVIFANAGGNLASGVLLRRAWHFHTIIVRAFLVCATLVAVGFSTSHPLAAALLFTAGIGIAGTIAAATMASAAYLTADVRQVGVLIGLFMQGSTLGQFAAPPVFALLVERFGWQPASLFLVALGCCGALAAATVGRMTLRRAG
jgi:MFS family permease